MSFENLSGKVNLQNKKFAKAGFIYPVCQIEGFNCQDEDDLVNFCADDTYFIHRPAIDKNKATFDFRLAPFQNWPISFVQKPNTLANAGFFYTSCGDKMRFYHCGCEIKLSNTKLCK